VLVALLAAVIGSATVTAQPAPCPDPARALGVSRVVEIDTSTGPLFGAITVHTKEPRFLGPKEVVLTFDDGPLPPVTKPILDTLDQYCTKATFFAVGRMAVAYPWMIRDIMTRGHTMGTHTWSHPLNLRRLSVERARDEIERGHAAITLAAGQPIAPFFRFPGLSDSGPLLGHLQTRGIATFTVDVVSNDSYIPSPERLLQRTLAEVERHDGGIVLFHDIKPATARMLPRFLAELKARGYKVVHMRPKAPVAPLPDFDAVLTPMVTKAVAAGPTPTLVPFFGLVKPGETGQPPVATVVPAARARLAPPPAEGRTPRPPRVRATAAETQTAAPAAATPAAAAPSAAPPAPRRPVRAAAEPDDDVWGIR
jgi:peptidoglycan/xylan/chitin deacetylase (PgdA/CDA1 family)